MTSLEQSWTRIQPILPEVTADRESPWESRRARFLEHLGIRSADDDPSIAPIFRELDEMPDSDRDQLLNSDRLDTWCYQRLAQALPERQQNQGPPAPAYDEQAWQRFLATNGGQWDGTEQSWPTFREWFAYHANEQHVGQPAEALLRYLDPMSVADRISTFGQYGVVIQQPRGDDGFAWVTPEQVAVLESKWHGEWRQRLTADLDTRWGANWPANPPEHKTAWLAQVIASGAYAAETPAGQGKTDEAFLREIAAAIREVPGVDQMSEDELQQAIAAAIQ